MKQNSLKWTKRNVVIQAIIGFLIFGTFVITLKNIIQQGAFNRNTLRPFVSYEIQRNLKVTEDFIKITNTIENSGRTPAYNVKIYSSFTTSSTFPIDYFKKIVNTDTTFYGIIIPKDRKINKEVKTQVYNQNGQLLNMIKIKINLSKESVFYHIYI